MQGKLDKNSQLNICADKNVNEILKTQMQHVSQIGLSGTPLFYIKGQIVDGFDVAAIENILKD